MSEALPIPTSPPSPKVPQVIITLAPDGSLQAELPGLNGARRIVPINSLESIRRILSAQLTGPCTIGYDAAPTSGQVRHWEQHDPSTGGARSDHCPWCIAESLGIDVSKPRRARRNYAIGNGTATVHYLKPRARKSSTSVRIKAPTTKEIDPNLTFEDLGL